MDFEALLGEARDLQRKLVELEARARELLDLQQGVTDIEIDFSSDGVTLEQANDKAKRTNTLDELLEAVKKNEI